MVEKQVCCYIFLYTYIINFFNVSFGQFMHVTKYAKYPIDPKLFNGGVLKKNKILAQVNDSTITID